MTVSEQLGEDKTGAGSPTADEFFIPDLCTPRAVLMMFILTELLVVVYVLGATSLPRFDWNALALASLFVQWIVMLCAGLFCAARPLLARVRLPMGVMLCFAIILLVTLATSVVAVVTLGEGFYSSTDPWWLMRNLVVASVIGGIALRYFYLQQQLRAREQAELNARIESLRSRIRPHFLFNTMNSIASLIGSKPEEAERVVEDLSELFRASLVENSDHSSLADELHLCELYLRIEQLRLGDRMRIIWDIDSHARGCEMPALLLQPLVENAVYHGVARIPEGGVIEVSAHALDGKVRVVITNPMPTVEGYESDGHQMALDNIRQRLDALYGGDARLDIQASRAIHRVELSIPRAVTES